MISIIISSVNQSQLAAVSANIDQTIGVEYELISVDNRKGEMGICEVYNRGAQLSKYDFLCFMHEDIKIHTANWGKIIKDTFIENPAYGLIGIAGSQYKSLAPSGWHCYDIMGDIQFYNIIQHYKFSNKETSLDYSNPGDVKLSKVACIDGAWFCCTKGAYFTYSFDQNLLRGFHGYDLDFSLGINQVYEVAVTFEILIEHFSEGKFDKKWLSEILKVHKKWSEILPLNLANLPRHQIYLQEKRAFKSIFKRMLAEGFTKKELFNVVWNSRKSKLMTFGLFLNLYFQVLKLIIRRSF